MFTKGGCYWLAKTLHQYIPGSEIVFNRRAQHCACWFDNGVYDISGRISGTGFYPATSRDMDYMKKHFVPYFDVKPIGEHVEKKITMMTEQIGRKIMYKDERMKESNLIQDEGKKAGVKRLPYKIKLLWDSVKVYTGPGKEYFSIASVSHRDTLEIIEKKEGKDERRWGRLKSGAGWIPLDHTQMI